MKAAQLLREIERERQRKEDHARIVQNHVEQLLKLRFVWPRSGSYGR